MKKLLGVLLVAVMSWPVSAAVPNKVEVIGEVQTIASDVTHQQDIAGDSLYNAGAWTRAMAGVSADLVEDVTANLLFQYGYAWGTNNEEGTGFGASGDNKVKVINANVALHNLLCAFDLTVGRQFYGDEDSAVMYIGPNHYNAETGLYAEALDAAKLTYSDDVKAFTMVAGKIADTYVDGLGVKFNTEAVLMGADFKYHFDEALMAQVYAYNVNNWRETGEDGTVYVDERNEQNAGIYGAKLAADMDAFRASAEYARNYGASHRIFREHKHTGHMLKLDVAADVEMFTARGAFLYANENFWAFGNYTPGLIVGHRLGGEIYDFTADGVRMFNIGFDVKPFEKWTVSLDGYSFQSSRGHHTATMEADLTAKYAHNEYVELFAGAGYVKYGHELTGFSTGFMGRKDNVKGQLGVTIRRN